MNGCFCSWLCCHDAIQNFPLDNLLRSRPLPSLLLGHGVQVVAAIVRLFDFISSSTLPVVYCLPLYVALPSRCFLYLRAANLLTALESAFPWSARAAIGLHSSYFCYHFDCQQSIRLSEHSGLPARQHSDQPSLLLLSASLAQPPSPHPPSCSLDLQLHCLSQHQSPLRQLKVPGYRCPS